MVGFFFVALLSLHLLIIYIVEPEKWLRLMYAFQKEES